MVAARKDLNIAAEGNEHLRSDFIGEWQLDRVSGLYDDRASSIVALRVGPHALSIHLRGNEGLCEVDVHFDGPVGEGANVRDGVSVQALLEGDALVWELERTGANDRVRRVMRLNPNGSQLIAERVDLTDEGAPRSLRTEYWIRSTHFGG